MRGHMRAPSRRWLRWTCIPSWCLACASISSRNWSSTSRRAWSGYGTGSISGSKAVEETLARDPRTGKFCVGDQVTVADLCLAAHLTSAKVLLGRDPTDYPNAGRIYATCMAMEAFSSEHPLRQPDAPAAH